MNQIDFVLTTTQISSSRSNSSSKLEDFDDETCMNDDETEYYSYIHTYNCLHEKLMLNRQTTKHEKRNIN